ncbi:MAG: TIGR04211 family SH3 domain-containing protein [Gammaproteobacteria bacterium]|nr:TIGR04211 family SH3 domain-containing protein [Gammaproteobacteria bacterium]
MRKAFPLLAALLLQAPVQAQTETAYVTDNLRLGVHQASDTSDRPFRTLESGQAMEIISRNRNYANVRLPDGVEGYVKATYLVFEKPARLIVAETEAEKAALQKELEDMKVVFAAPAATIRSLEQRLAESQAAVETRAAQVSELSAQVDEFRGRQDRFKYSMPMTWVGGAMFLCLLAGFLAALWWVDRASRKRHGGIRIY